MEKAKRGRPRKIKEAEQAEICLSEGSASTKSDTPPTKAEDNKVKQLQFKCENIDKIREQQNARYEKIKGELALKRLLSTIFSDKYTDDQRLELLKELQTKLNNN
jgi:hypothetical protein